MFRRTTEVAVNKRARLARRILRDHRRGRVHHRFRHGPDGVFSTFWHCPRCRFRFIGQAEVPHAYR